MTVSGFNSSDLVQQNLSRYANSHPGQLSLAIPPWVVKGVIGGDSLRLRVKASMARVVFEAGETVRSLVNTCHYCPSERFSRCFNNKAIYRFTLLYRVPRSDHPKTSTLVTICQFLRHFTKITFHFCTRVPDFSTVLRRLYFNTNSNSSLLRQHWKSPDWQKFRRWWPTGEWRRTGYRQNAKATKYHTKMPQKDVCSQKCAKNVSWTKFCGIFVLCTCAFPRKENVLAWRAMSICCSPADLCCIHYSVAIASSPIFKILLRANYVCLWHFVVQPGRLTCMYTDPMFNRIRCVVLVYSRLYETRSTHLGVLCHYNQ